MGNLFIESKIYKHPSCNGFCYAGAFGGGVAGVYGVALSSFYDETLNNEFLGWDTNKPIYAWGYDSNRNEYVHPVKLKFESYTNLGNIVVSTTDPKDLSGYRIRISGYFNSDLISAYMDSYIDLLYINMRGYGGYGLSNPSGQTIQWAVGTKYNSGFYDFIITENTTREELRFRKYVTKAGSMVSFQDDDNQLIGTTFLTNSVLKANPVDLKVNLDIYVNDTFESSKVASFAYSLDKDFRFTHNFKPVLQALFGGKLYEGEINPLDGNIAKIDDLTGTLVKKVFYKISTQSFNILRNSSDIIQFWSAPFISSTGHATLEEYLPPADYNQKHFVVSPFSIKKDSTTEIGYLTGTGGVIAPIGLVVRNRTSSPIDIKFFSDSDALLATTPIVGNDVSFLVLTIPQPIKTDSITIENDDGLFILGFSLKNKGAYKNQTSIFWNSPQGLGQFFFNCDYAEELTGSSVVTIENTITNTITNYGTDVKRKLSLKSEHLNKLEIKGLSSLVNSSQQWLYSYAQKRLIPIKVITKSARVREISEVRYSFEVDIEIQKDIEL